MARRDRSPAPLSSAHTVLVVVTALLVIALVLCLGVGIAGMSRPWPWPGPSPSSSPPTGSSASPASRAERVVVPVVTGRALGAAEEQLHAAALTDIEHRDGSGRSRLVLDRRDWVVIAQSPRAGRAVPAGTAVTLTVRRIGDASAPPGTVEGVVPAVVCRDLPTAEETLEDAGFRDVRSEDATGQVRHQIIDRNWIVVSQGVRPGTRTGRWTRIVLRVVKAGEPTGCRS
jgi:hypothetical protein